ncbi:hypothetical protein CNECB9_1850002 [Cupriavidus necator]|uniref:Uncharacterized protein n=1 Tax=Cupriavidus necator TaxID=106590 RepID=A0A1K0J635_CUPNE|nr:hypothetical protein CNECB9_1850002 [Cupriavidus necator]
MASCWPSRLAICPHAFRGTIPLDWYDLRCTQYLSHTETNLKRNTAMRKGGFTAEANGGRN